MFWKLSFKDHFKVDTIIKKNPENENPMRRSCIIHSLHYNLHFQEQEKCF